jgi:hypothetical protein
MFVQGTLLKTIGATGDVQAGDGPEAPMWESAGHTRGTLAASRDSPTGATLISPRKAFPGRVPMQRSISRRTSIYAVGFGF